MTLCLWFALIILHANHTYVQPYYVWIIYGLSGPNIFIVINDFQKNAFDMICASYIYNFYLKLFSTQEEWSKMV
jgi:hypothetical protein